MNIKIVYEDNNFLAINKPSGVLVHATTHGNNEGTLVEFLLSKYPEIKNVGDLPTGRQAFHIRPGIVHRLDKDTSGVMIIAKNQEYFLYLKNLFQTHKVTKTYLALVYGAVKEKEGIINKPIGLKPGTTKRTVFIKNAKMVKEAVTEYKLQKIINIEGQEYSLLKVFPKTGRTHQVRVHLASIGHPVVGDKQYGSKKLLSLVGRLFLHADSIEFEKSPGEVIKIGADLPKELQIFLTK